MHCFLFSVMYVLFSLFFHLVFNTSGDSLFPSSVFLITCSGLGAVRFVFSTNQFIIVHSLWLVLQKNSLKSFCSFF